MITRIIPLALMLLLLGGCTGNSSDTSGLNTDSTGFAGEVELAENREIEIVKEEVLPMEIDTVLEAYITKIGFSEAFTVSTNHESYMLNGYFNDDSVTDTVIIVKHKKNLKDGLLIKHGNTSECIILGAGEDVLAQGFDDFSWIGVFDKINKGEKVASNIDEEGNIIAEDVPDSLKTKLKNEGIYVHEAESCGGGIIHWDNKKYNWIQQE